MTTMTAEAEVQEVTWAGEQNPNCAPGFTGYVLKYAHHDENSVKVFWHERGSATWERRKNLNFV